MRVHRLDKSIKETQIPHPPLNVPTGAPKSQLRKLTHELMSRFNLHYNHLAL